MKKQWILLSTLALFIGLYVAGSYLYTSANHTIPNEQQSSLYRSHAFVVGKEDTPITIVEFFDPACVTCKNFYPFVKEFLKKYPKELKLVLRYAPFHKDSSIVVAMIEASRLQNRYLETLEVIYRYQDQWVSQHTPNIARIWSFLPEAGVDIERLKEDMKKPEIEAIITQDMADVKTLGIKATPEFFVNGKPLVKFGYKELQTLIESEL